MHYKTSDFASKEKLALEPIDPTQTKKYRIGQRDAMSVSDINELNSVYE